MQLFNSVALLMSTNAFNVPAKLWLYAPFPPYRSSAPPPDGAWRSVPVDIAPVALRFFVELCPEIKKYRLLPSNCQTYDFFFVTNGV